MPNLDLDLSEALEMHEVHFGYPADISKSSDPVRDVLEAIARGVPLFDADSLTKVN